MATESGADDISIMRCNKPSTPQPIDETNPILDKEE